MSLQVSGLTSSYGYMSAMQSMRGNQGIQGPPPGPPPLEGKEFSDIDTDGDGSISSDELKGILDQGRSGNESSSASSADDSRFSDFYSKLDSDEDGSISSTEWDTFQQDIAQNQVKQGMQGPPPGPPPLEGKDFSDIDSDGDGSISSDELKSIMGQDDSTDETSDARFQDFFTKLDSDGDGKVSSSEWDAFQQDIKKHDHSKSGASQAQSNQQINAGLQNLISQLYSGMDTNGDGQVSKDELTAWLQESLSTVNFAA